MQQTQVLSSRQSTKRSTKHGILLWVWLTIYRYTLKSHGFESHFPQLPQIGIYRPRVWQTHCWCCAKQITVCVPSILLWSKYQSLSFLPRWNLFGIIWNFDGHEDLMGTPSQGDALAYSERFKIHHAQRVDFHIKTLSFIFLFQYSRLPTLHIWEQTKDWALDSGAPLKISDALGPKPHLCWDHPPVMLLRHSTSANSSLAKWTPETRQV
jgi:hypothetical protein